MKSHSARALPFTVLLLLSVVLSSCATGCPPACLGERIGSVDWSGRNLSGGVLVNTAARQSTLNNVDFSGADLSGMDISGASMKAADLTDSILIGTDLENAYLSGAVFTRANLTGANLGMADLTGVTLSSTDLTAATFGDSRLVNADLGQLNLAGAIMDGSVMTGANLDRVNLAGSLLRRVDLSGANMHLADLRGSWINLSTLVAADLREANLSGATLIGTDLTGANLAEASLSGANLIGAVLRGADLRGADLSSAELIATPELLDRKNMVDEILNGMSESQFAKLALGDAVLDGARYDDQTQWPQGYTPPSGAVYLSSASSPQLGEDAVKHIEEEIQVVGSAAVSDIVEPLADAYSLNNPDLIIRVTVTDSTNGIAQAGSRIADVGMSSRAVIPAEQARFAGLNVVHVADDSIVAVVNLHNPVTNLTVDQLRAIYAGEIRNWKELGGPDLKITFLQQQITLIEVFKELVMGDTPIRDDLALTLPTNPAVRAAVAGNSGAIGLLPKRFADSSVKPLALNGVSATRDSIRFGQYPLIRSLYLVTDGKPGDQVQGWLDFIASAAGRETILYEGLEPAYDD